MSCLFDLSEGHILFPIRKNKIDTSSGSYGTTFPCTGKASGQRASVKREKRPPCAKGALPEGRWGIVSAGRGNNPSVTHRVPPPFAQGRLIADAQCASLHGAIPYPLPFRRTGVGADDHIGPRDAVVCVPYRHLTGGARQKNSRRLYLISE